MCAAVVGASVGADGTDAASHKRPHQKKRKSQITPLELSQLRPLEWPVALVEFATIAGPSVTVDAHGKQLYGRTRHSNQSPRSSFFCGGHLYRWWVDHSTRRKVTRKTTGLHRKRRVFAERRIKHVSHILAPVV